MHRTRTRTRDATHVHHALRAKHTYLRIYKTQIITDVGISVNKDYPVYTALMESGAYIKSYGTDTPIMGQVWPGI
jgi:hypothetical protein